MAIRVPLYEVEVVGADGKRRPLRFHADNKRSAERRAWVAIKLRPELRDGKPDLRTLRLVG